MTALRKIAGICGMILGVAAIWMAISFARLLANPPPVSSGDSYSKTVIVVIGVLGMALTMVAYNFGFRRH